MTGLRTLTMLALTLVLASCNGRERSTELVIHRDSGAVASALSDISLGEVAEILPQAQAVRSQPAENQLLYTLPGDTPERTATVRFDLAPVDGGGGTRVTMHLSVPEGEVRVGGERKVVNLTKVEGLMRRGLGHLGQALEHHDSTDSARSELGEVLTVLALANHAGAIDKLQDLARNPNHALDEIIGRMAAGSGHFGEPTMPTMARGTDPRPEDPTPDEVRPMSNPTGTAPQPTL